MRSYSLAMDYFKTYLKMNDIGQLWRQIRYVSRRRAMQLVRWKEDVYEEKERGCSILVRLRRLCVFFALFLLLCVFVSFIGDDV